MASLKSLFARAWAKTAWNATTSAYRRGMFHMSGPSLSLKHDPIAVVVCLWNRPQRIESVLSMLDLQNSERPIHLFLWNNRFSDAKHYRKAVDNFKANGTLKHVSLFNSPYNVGGLARFYVARKLRIHGYRRGFIMLDDDQNVTANFVADLLAIDAPLSISGYWAWTMYGDYWSRTPAQPGDRVSYVGTGGTICDIEIVADRRFFTELPRYFAFLEDLWMSGYARKVGWSLNKAAIDVEFVLDETNQHHKLGEKKGEFYRYLQLDDGEHLDPKAPL